VRRVRPARRASRLQPDEAHQAHQPLHTLAIHRVAALAQPLGHLAAAVDRPRRVQLVDEPHQRQIFLGRLLRLLGPWPRRSGGCSSAIVATCAARLVAWRNGTRVLMPKLDVVY